MDRSIGFARLRLKSYKIRYEVEIAHQNGSITSYVCVDGADVICHMFDELCRLDGGGEIRIKKLVAPKNFG